MSVGEIVCGIAYAKAIVARRVRTIREIALVLCGSIIILEAARQ